MSHILFFTGQYTPALASNNDDKIFVFGDNSCDYGIGGQAIIRGFPNALGVPTKWAPNDRPSSFYTELCFDSTLIEARLDAIGRKLASGFIVVIPGTYDRIELGTGLAELPTRAPAVYQTICEQIRLIADHFGVTTDPLS